MPMDATPGCGRNKDSISLASGVTSAKFHVMTYRLISGEAELRDAIKVVQPNSCSNTLRLQTAFLQVKIISIACFEEPHQN